MFYFVVAASALGVLLLVNFLLLKFSCNDTDPKNKNRKERRSGHEKQKRTAFAGSRFTVAEE